MRRHLHCVGGTSKHHHTNPVKETPSRDGGSSRELNAYAVEERPSVSGVGIRVGRRRHLPDDIRGQERERRGNDVRAIVRGRRPEIGAPLWVICHGRPLAALAIRKLVPNI